MESFGEGTMSIIAGLIRYPAEVYDQVKAAGTFYPPNDRDIQQCHLSRSWDEIHPALRSFGFPLSLALSGDFGYEGGLDEFGWDEANESDHYLGFVSPPLVAKIAAQLGQLSFGQVKEKLTEDSRGAEYVEPRFMELVEFYIAAATAGDCVFIHVA